MRLILTLNTKYIYYEIVLKRYKKNKKSLKNHMVDKYEIKKQYVMRKTRQVDIQWPVSSENQLEQHTRYIHSAMTNIL